MSFDGLIDRKGRLKEAYYNIYSHNNSQKATFDIPEINILRPAQLIYNDHSYTYTAMIYSNEEGWKSGTKKERFNYEWTLIKCDEYGNEIALKELAETPKLTLKIPKNHERYRLQLSVLKGNQIKQVQTKLNTLLIEVELSENN